VWLFRKREQRLPAWAFTLLTALLIAAPLGWFYYNWRLFGDPLDFMRGPYSAKAIQLRSSPPGSQHYPGWHDMSTAFLYYRTAAALACGPLWLSNVIYTLSLAGLALFAWIRRWNSTVLWLLWVPLPFYAYSIAYGSVPLFMPQWKPNAWYNTRYGLEMLPAFALSLGLMMQWLGGQTAACGPRVKKASLVALFALLAVEDVWLVWTKPLVFQEAEKNSSTRIPFESMLATELFLLPENARILMVTSDHVGALQRAGVPLVHTVNESDWSWFDKALASPATQVDYVVAMDGDAVARAVAVHPQGLVLEDTICSKGQPCARIYRSDTPHAH
jgi:hypothetical protein